MERKFSSTFNDSLLSTSNYLEVPHVSESDLHFVYNNLTNSEQRLFTMKTGWPTGKPLKLRTISRREGMSIGKTSERYKELAHKINKLLRR